MVHTFTERIEIFSIRMANEINYTKVGGYFLIAAVASLIFVDCTEIATVQTEESLKHNKAVIKTIEVQGVCVCVCILPFPIFFFLISNIF